MLHRFARILSIVTLASTAACVSPAVADLSGLGWGTRLTPLTALAGQTPLDSLPPGAWSPLFAPPSTDTTVNTMIVADSQLVAAGEFDRVGVYHNAHGVASWDGTRWFGYGAGLPGGVRALAVWNNQLVAGGTFSLGSGAAANYLATWDGSSWRQFPVEVDGPVRALAVYHGRLVVGGDFTAAGSTTLNCVGAWDGATWSSLAGGITYIPSPPVTTGPTIDALYVLSDKLFAGGSIATAGGVAAQNIAAWNDTTWSALTTGCNGPVLALCAYSGKLVVAGWFAYAGSLITGSIAAWNGSAWSRFSYGMDMEVESVAAFNGKLIAAGRFGLAGGVTCWSVAQWSNTTHLWSPCAGGLGADWTLYCCEIAPALCVYKNRCYLGGWFDEAGTLVSRNLAGWDGTTWSTPLPGNGLSYDGLALASYHDKLYAGGTFYEAGALVAHYLVAWNDSAWTALGSGLQGTAVYSLAVFADKLAVGGLLTSAGGVIVSNIATWDGSAWAALGSGLDGAVFALTVWNGQLVAGGQFTHAGGLAASHLAL